MIVDDIVETFSRDVRDFEAADVMYAAPFVCGAYALAFSATSVAMHWF